MKIISVAGARPNFMKIAPLHKAFLRRGEDVQHLICHTGQHFDDNMSKVFFEQLELPRPDFNLGVGGGSQAVQTARIIERFEEVALKERPDLVIVVGDVNSTLACSLTAAKLHIPVAHVESGLRSFDKTMPEEINRKMTDAVSDFLFVTEPSGMKNLEAEGFGRPLPRGQGPVIAFVGNVMIDSLVACLAKAQESGILGAIGAKEKQYLLATFHRPSNVDEPAALRGLVEFLNRMAESIRVVFPIHPRTRGNLAGFGLADLWHRNVTLLDPVGYIEMLTLIRNARIVVTDSGGIQEETTYLGIQCVTARESTERPVTVDVGTNHLAGTDIRNVEKTTVEILDGKIKAGRIPDLWDGKAADRIVEILLNSRFSR